MTTAFIHANIADVIGAALIPDSSILVEDGIITAAGRDVSVPQDAKIIDLQGKTLLPGLFNCHIQKALIGRLTRLV